jgi:signal transduction histidine kinase
MLNRLTEWILAVPVFVKVMGIAMGMAGLLGGGMLWQIHRTWHAHQIAELEARGLKLAREVASHCADLSRAGLAADIPAELRHSLEESPDIAYLVLQSTNHVTLAEARDPALEQNPAALRELVVPLAGGPHSLRVGLSSARVAAEVGWLTRRLARTTALITLFGLLAAWALTHVFAHPVQELVELTRAVKAGNYQAKAPVRARDEVGELATAFNEMTAAIAQKEAARQQLLRQVIQAAEEERKRIARELHDHTGQALTSQIATLSAMENQLGDSAIRQRLQDLRRQIEQTLDEVHDLSIRLRPSVLDDVGLMAALQRHCRLVSLRSGAHVACTDAGLDGERLPAEVELTVYRVVQEAVTNSLRHGRATQITATLERLPRQLRATVQDNGAGFDAGNWRQRCAQGNHLGLIGIEERVRLLEGELSVDSAPGQGVILRAEIPLPEVA